MPALYIQISGVVQGVGFRPFVYRIAHQFAIKGWVLNGDKGVEIHAEGEALEGFLKALTTQAPPVASISKVTSQRITMQGYHEFSIRESHKQNHPTVRISPDLTVCPNCLQELADPDNRRYHYAYINCTDCGPRYSIITGLPYDRPQTTMQGFIMCSACQQEYENPLDRRFHAQPTACPTCGPKYILQVKGETFEQDVIEKTIALLKAGKIIAIKGIGGYHLACDAQNTSAVWALRERKFRKDKPFALMVKDVETASRYVELTQEAIKLLTSAARPIIVASAKQYLEGVSPDNHDLGVMLPYTPLHFLLFAAAAPEVLVLTSANRSSEPIAYRDSAALEQLSDLADAFLIGERPIARRVEDSIARVSPFGTQLLRRARGYAPGSVARLPTDEPILALGADLKNSLTLVVNGEAFVSQHLGDLDHLESFNAFTETIDDLLKMYELDIGEMTVVHDLHPEYRSSQYAASLPAKGILSVQHHVAHIASVLAEHHCFDKNVLGISWDGTGYGTDQASWGGEVFVGSLSTGFERIAQLKYASLVGGDAAAHYPVQAALGFLEGFDTDFSQAPFSFPERYARARQLLEKKLRVFPTSSIGRLFDAVAALLGFTKAQSFEGQAAIWLEHLARKSQSRDLYPFPFTHNLWDYQPLVDAIIQERLRGKNIADIARGFIGSLAKGLMVAAEQLCQEHRLEQVVFSGGVFQNLLLLQAIKDHAAVSKLAMLVNQSVPCNDGGISLGQAAISLNA
jgi:hydrogenase maturation protein HypF